LIDGAGSDEIARFPFNPKTAIRSLGERLAHLRLRGNIYWAKRLPKKKGDHLNLRDDRPFWVRG
ncbi:MAG: hypothetical protein Q7U55_01380, partial [Deltaproteobacteria bacterium]|nr:hypothetical protein [Deltaproteobacteria bacterium]